MTWQKVFENPANKHRAYRAAVAADAAWSRELQRVYGKRAGDARYDKRGVATPELRRLHAAWVAAEQRRENPRGYQPGESVHQRYQRLLTEFDEGMAEAEQAERDGYEEEAKQRRRTAQSSMRDADALLRQVEAGNYTWGERY